MIYSIVTSYTTVIDVAGPWVLSEPECKQFKEVQLSAIEFKKRGFTSEYQLDCICRDFEEEPKIGETIRN